jgi:hypothetical protein
MAPRTAVPLQTAPDDGPELARFMRETVNVPFSYAMFELEASDGGETSPRVHRAALVLAHAATGLRSWKDPPVTSDEGRAVFFEYANNLSKHVASLETDPASASYHLEAIRQTCNGCHHFFRRATPGSSDVGYDFDVLQAGVRR